MSSVHSILSLDDLPQLGRGLRHLPRPQDALLTLDQQRGDLEEKYSHFHLHLTIIIKSNCWKLDSLSFFSFDFPSKSIAFVLSRLQRHNYKRTHSVLFLSLLDLNVRNVCGAKRWWQVASEMVTSALDRLSRVQLCKKSSCSQILMPTPPVSSPATQSRTPLLQHSP